MRTCAPVKCDLLVKLMWAGVNMTSGPARMAVLWSTRPSAGEAMKVGSGSNQFHRNRSDDCYGLKAAADVCNRELPVLPPIAVIAQAV